MAVQGGNNQYGDGGWSGNPGPMGPGGPGPMGQPPGGEYNFDGQYPQDPYGYPPQPDYQQGGYPPQPGYPQPGYPPQGPGYQQPGYPPQDPGYPPQDPGWQQSAPPYPQQSAPPYQQQSAPPYPQQPASPYQQQSAPPYPGQEYGQMQYPGTQMYPPGMPPPPQRSNNALIMGLLAGAVVLLLLVGGYFYLSDGSGGNNQADPTSSASASPQETASPSASPSRTPTASPKASTRSLTSLDSSSTDTTPMVYSQFFHNKSFTSSAGETYSLEAYKVYDDCSEAGGTKVKSLLTANGCTKLPVAVYLNSTEDVMIGVLVIPTTSTSAATTVYNAVNSDSSLRTDFTIWCPPTSRPGGDVCNSSIPSGTYIYLNYLAFHRYTLVTVELYTDARTKGDSKTLSDDGKACISEVADSIPRVYS